MDSSAATGLLTDADDTLWENNIYFEQVRKKFLQWIEELGFRTPDVQEAFVQIEHEKIQKEWLPAENFIASNRVRSA
jgi:putative hydrolase of the HAD superfamily